MKTLWSPTWRVARWLWSRGSCCLRLLGLPFLLPLLPQLLLLLGQLGPLLPTLCKLFRAMLLDYLTSEKLVKEFESEKQPIFHYKIPVFKKNHFLFWSFGILITFNHLLIVKLFSVYRTVPPGMIFIKKSKFKKIWVNGWLGKIYDEKNANIRGKR